MDQTEECTVRARGRRRDSQTKHRHRVAACYEKLKVSVPGVCERIPCRSPSARTKLKSLSKPDILQQSKQYILHLENVLSRLLKKKEDRSIDSHPDIELQVSSNQVSQVLQDFESLDDFRAHFGTKFHVKGDVLSYFQENDKEFGSQRCTRNKPDSSVCLDMTHVVLSPASRERDKRHKARKCQAELSSQSSTKSRGSSQQSLDHGFFSGEGGSQERTFDKQGSQSSLEKNAGSTYEIQALGSPFRLQQPNFGTFSSGAFFDSSHLYFYVPATGYPTPFLSPYFPPLLSANFSPMRKRATDISGRNVSGGFSGSFASRLTDASLLSHDCPSTSNTEATLDFCQKQYHATPAEVSLSKPVPTASNESKRSVKLVR